MSAESTVFQFPDESGHMQYLGPILKLSDVEQLLVDKLNLQLVPTINSLVARVEDLSTEIRTIKQELAGIPTVVKSSFESKDDEIHTALGTVTNQLESVLACVRQLQPSVTLSSVNSSPSSAGQSGLVSPEPYVTVNMGGRDFPYFLNHAVWGQISGCVIPRTIARVVLESMYSIRELRDYTLTGKGNASNKGNPTQAQSRKKIPSESVEIAKAVVLKVMDGEIRKKHVDAVNEHGHNPYLNEVEKVRKQVRADIRNILQAYRDDYDDEGIKIAKKRSRPILQESDKNIPNGEDEENFLD